MRFIISTAVWILLLPYILCWHIPLCILESLVCKPEPEPEPCKSKRG